MYRVKPTLITLVVECAEKLRYYGHLVTKKHKNILELEKLTILWHLGNVFRSNKVISSAELMRDYLPITFVHMLIFTLQGCESGSKNVASY